MKAIIGKTHVVVYDDDGDFVVQYPVSIDSRYPGEPPIMYAIRRVQSFIPECERKIINAQRAIERTNEMLEVLRNAKPED